MSVLARKCQYISSLRTLDDKIAIVQSVALQKVILNTLGELVQFKDGLHCLGVGHEIAKHGELLQQFISKAKAN